MYVTDMSMSSKMFFIHMGVGCFPVDSMHDHKLTDPSDKGEIMIGLNVDQDGEGWRR